MRAKYDSVYQNVNVYKPSALYHTSLFLVRRLLFAVVVIHCQVSIVLQVVLADILSTLLLIFFVTIKPMEDRLSNVVQFVNEAVVLVSVWLLFWFTAFVPAPQTRYDLAWHFMYFISADIFFNLLILIFSLVRKVYCTIRTAIYMRNAKKVR